MKQKGRKWVKGMKISLSPTHTQAGEEHDTQTAFDLSLTQAEANISKLCLEDLNPHSLIV